ncbi:ShlB/FhaC/HecB family hemolysin secretion/activation protein [Thiovibrio frasassiensis]|uniref:ShlB/FhaC/HecB family hemolysin secretion/activation protein n=1 Tax=Thiovibrio frasassiensis TaxID=2984131 RepID=A0A9X4MF71_9BACT|nr:ShlB/FhaC/HecB family hemolysin secretion/activation protein [Thiovibrio frasassiensis]MDG4475226.1 ShlB/FhaC/HecB family hemolysin secretion/activation protein [Thiovibrio frasassiensis]
MTRTDAANADIRLTVSGIRVSGSSAFAAAELEALVANLIGGEHTLAELYQGAARITAYYREHGYVIARAYLPAQEIQDGVVIINVVEGRIGEQHINNQSRLSDARANNYLQGVKSGDALQAAPVERALLLLNDTPGVGGTRATLQPGASVGTSDLIVEIDPSLPYAARVEMNNFGNRYTGEYRLDGALALNSPFRMGDQFTVRALTSDQDLTYARMAYQVPVGSDGLRLGAAYFDTRYRLGKEFAPLQAHGTATSSTLFGVYPFIRSQTANLSGTLSLENKQLSDYTDAPVTTVDKEIQLANFGLAGNHQDRLGGAGITSFDLSLALGLLGMDAESLSADSLTTRSDGGFTRLAYNVNRVQRLTDLDSLSVSLSGQWADKNLNSSEKFFLGGAYGVRAYPQGEASGDQGWLTNLELRHRFLPNLQGVVFYDAGSVRINHDPFVAGENSRTISGAGVGANSTFLGLQINAYVAWRIDGDQPTSEPASVDRNPRLWLQASWQH